MIRRWCVAFNTWYDGLPDGPRFLVFLALMVPWIGFIATGSYWKPSLWLWLGYALLLVFVRCFGVRK